MMVGAAALVLVSACSGSGSSGAKKAPATTTPPATFLGPTSTIAASPRTVVTLPSALGPGPAHVAGTVTGPEGVIPGATVKIERLVDDTAIAATTVETGADGHWALDSVNGGRYRLRAWRVPDLTQLTPAVVFVAVDDTRPIDLPVLRYQATGAPVARIVPDPPVVGQPAVLVIGAASGDVDSEGVLHSGARPGLAVTVAGSTNVTIVPTTPVGTDANGNAAFQLLCTQPGPVTLAVTIATTAQPIPLPACAVA